MPKFEPADSGFADRVRDSFERQAAMRTIGASILRVAAGEVDLGLAFREDLTQQHGFLHAGILATILDSACGYAAYSLMAADDAVLSIEYKINMLAPARGERIVARARIVRAGRTITVCSGDAFAVTDGAETLVATMTATMMTVQGRKGLQG
jgi:uncharacterized protein (TIGR00369 family)